LRGPWLRARHGDMRYNDMARRDERGSAAAGALGSRARRWPRKNDAAAIEARRAAMHLDAGLVTSVDLEPFASAAESLVGVAVIPVSAVPLTIELGDYALSDEGAVVE